MPKGIYLRSEKQKKKISEARKKYFDEHGRVVEIDQKVNPTEYQREYQRLWRKRNPQYYKNYKRKKAVSKEVKLEDIVAKFNEFQVACIECGCGTRAYNQEELDSLAIELKRMMMKYILIIGEDKDERN